MGKRWSSFTTSPGPTRRASTTLHAPIRLKTVELPLTGKDVENGSVARGALPDSNGSGTYSLRVRIASQSSSNDRRRGGGFAELLGSENKRHNINCWYCSNLITEGTACAFNCDHRGLVLTDFIPAFQPKAPAANYQHWVTRTILFKTMLSNETRVLFSISADIEVLLRDVYGRTLRAKSKGLAIKTSIRGILTHISLSRSSSSPPG